MKELIDVIELLDKAIKEDGNNSITNGNIIKDGYNIEIDNYRDFINNSKEWLTNYQHKLQKETGIQNLKIKYTNIMGYFIEIPKSSISKISDDFIHKQTLINVGRYVTIELNDFYEKLAAGESSLFEKEYIIFQEIRENILISFGEIKKASKNMAFLDFGVSLAKVSYNNNFSKPNISEKFDLNIKNGRHPIIESNGKDFISNDLNLSRKKFINIITGPNMGGKSTFLRQNALIVLLAHIGSYIPASNAIIPLTDKIFSRVGAQDNLYLGQSTFMVEMQEVANILNNSTRSSFVIIDEVGRGTSTYDGMALAWAILKKLNDKIKSKVLFATHYHELIDKSVLLNSVSNYSVAVGENSENLVFLRKIIPGGIKKSYGIEVSKIAGLPIDVIDEARNMLLKLESNKNNKNGQLSLYDAISSNTNEIKIVYKDSSINEEINNMDIDNLTPIEAINKLHKLKKLLNENN